MSGGTNGSAVDPPAPSSIEVDIKVARYRTALVALIAMIRRTNEYRSWPDQMLIAQVERMLDDESLTSK